MELFSFPCYQNHPSTFLHNPLISSPISSILSLFSVYATSSFCDSLTMLIITTCLIFREESIQSKLKCVPALSLLIFFTKWNCKTNNTFFTTWGQEGTHWFLPYCWFFLSSYLYNILSTFNYIIWSNHLMIFSSNELYVQSLIYSVYGAAAEIFVCDIAEAVSKRAVRFLFEEYNVLLNVTSLMWWNCAIVLLLMQLKGAKIPESEYKTLPNGLKLVYRHVY